MKKTLLSLAVVAASGVAQASELYNGRVSAMGGAGYVTAGYADGVLYNPSSLARYNDSDDGAFVINLGALAQDEGDLVDNLDNLVDLTDRISYNDILTTNDARDLKELLSKVDEQTIQLTGGGSVVVALPTKLISAAVVVKGTVALNATPSIADDDFDVIDAAICVGDAYDNRDVNATCPRFDPEADLSSSVTARGAAIQEVGIALAKSFELGGNNTLLVGVTPKRVEVDTIVYRAEIANFDEDDIDADDYRTTGTVTTMDVGATMIHGNFSYGLTVQNLSGKSFKTVDNDVYELETRSTAAVGYTNKYMRAEASLDLNPIGVYGFKGDTQMMRVGVELSPLSWVQLRAGYQSDLESTLPDAFTVGLGLSPFDTINIDLAALKGSDDAVGAALQLGLRF